MCRLKTLRRLDQDAVFRAFSSSDHDCRRCGKTKCTRAGNDQDGNSRGQCELKCLPGKEPYDPGSQGNDNNNGNENAGDFICKLCDRGFGTGCIFHQLYDLGKRRIIPYLCSPEFNKSPFINRCADDFISGGFLHRDAFPGQSALIHGSHAFKDDSVNRNAGSGAHYHRISLIQLLHRDLNLFPAPFYGGGLRSQI